MTNYIRIITLLLAFWMMSIVQANTSKPNILVIWGDDIGQSNISVYTMGMMGYQTPNIDRIAKEGMIFTDYYGEQSCTAGRSSYVTGQSVYRTGLSKVRLPGAELGLQEEDPTIAGLLKAQGYMTGQFGKITLVIKMSIYRPTTVLMNSSATSIILMLKKNRKMKIIPVIPISRKNLDHAV